MTSGPGLLLLHGFTGGPESWVHVRARLPAAIRVAAPAILGHRGASSRAESFTAEVDRLAGEATSRLGARFAVAGYSLGGRLALGLAIRHPERVTRLTLLGARAGLSDAAERAARIAEDEAWAAKALAEGADAFATQWEARPLFAGPEAKLAPELRAARRALRRQHAPEGLARALRVLGLGRMPDYGPALASLNLPVTLVVGEDDGKFRELAVAMARTLPRARQVVVADAGHDVVLAAPERVAALLSDEEAP